MGKVDELENSVNHSISTGLTARKHYLESNHFTSYWSIRSTLSIYNSEGFPSLFDKFLYSMKIKEQTRKLAAGWSKHCFEVVDKTDISQSHIYNQRRRWLGSLKRFSKSIKYRNRSKVKAHSLFPTFSIMVLQLLLLQLLPLFIGHHVSSFDCAKVCIEACLTSYTFKDLLF